MVAPRFYPEGGGLELYVKNLTDGLIEKGHQVTVVCSTYQKKDSTEQTGALRVIRQKADLLISNTPLRFSLLFDLIKLIKEENFDVINAHTPVPYYADMTATACLLLRKKYFVTYHSSSLYKGNLLLDVMAFFYGFVLNMLFFFSSKIILESKNQSFVLKKALNSKTHVINPRVNRNDFDKFTQDKKVFDLLFVGQLKKGHEWKGLASLFFMISQIKVRYSDLRLAVAGDGDRLEFYKKTALSLGIESNVLFLGRIANDKIGEIYCQSKIFVLPSYAADAFPLACLDALYYGLPIVANDVGGVKEMVQNEANGYLCNHKKQQQFINSITTLLENEQLRHRFAAYSQKLYQENFSKNNVDEFLKDVMQ